MRSAELENLQSAEVKTGRYMTVIYNNDHTSIDDVILAIMTATNCDAQEAFMETWEAHTYGKAPIHFADQVECVQVARIIEQIDVKTEVCLEWND